MTEGDMEHLLLKAAVTVTDQGVFEAVISTANIDREKDIVDPSGMVKALRKWNRPIPLAWHHSVKAEDIFGTVDGQSAEVVNGNEVKVTGQVDLSMPVGEQAWRSMKARSLGFSFGYLIPDGGAVKRKGGGLHIHELDVFEITATRAPMNNDTRILSTKAAVCETCGQSIGQKTSDSEPALPALSEEGRSETLPATAGTGTSDAKKSDSEYWDDLRRESHRLATSVLLGE